MRSDSIQKLRQSIRPIADFPKKGIQFHDITPLLSDPALFKKSILLFKKLIKSKVDYVISVESRGFMFGSALAYALGAGFVPVRKQGKLPAKTFSQSYDLEYGSAAVEIHTDSIRKGARVVIMDDVLATGGTVGAVVCLVNKFDAKIVGAFFLIELTALGGRKKLKGLPVHSLITY